MEFNYPIYQIHLVNKSVSNITLHLYSSPFIPNIGDIILMEEDTFFKVSQRIISGESFNATVVLDGHIMKES